MLLPLAGCSGSASVSLAEEQIPRFHQSLDAAKFQEIYAAASEELKKASSEKDFVALLEAVHRKLGAAKSSEKQNWNVGVYTSGTSVSLTYKTVYTEGDATEKFVYRIKGDQALLLGYHISSNALILK